MFFMVFAFAQSQDQCDKNKKVKTEKVNANKSMPEEKTKFENLPDGAKLTDEVREVIKGDEGKVVSDEIITVEEKLKKIGAKYEDGKLVDSEGKEIRFYKPPVRGASQGFEEDQKQAKSDAEELKELQEKYTVIVLYVNPLTVM
jgi:hypothetical protein